MQIVSWNCRGLGSKTKEEALRDLTRLARPEVLLIQETKLEKEDLLRASNLFWKKGPARAVSARGASGGIATFWDSSKFDLIEDAATTHWLYTKLMHKGSGYLVSLFNLYVPVLINEKKDCWDSLALFLNHSNSVNIIVAGDLNVTLSQSEKKGGSIVRDPAREWVEDLISGWELEDITPSNGRFTWSNRRLGPGHIAARLDRFLVQSSFLSLGLIASSKVLPHSTSDHKPVSLALFPSSSLGPLPFRFCPYWALQDSFHSLVLRSWNHPVSGSPFFVWEEKLRNLKWTLKLWAKNLETPMAEKGKIQEKLERHQAVLEVSQVTQELLHQETDLQRQYHKACRDEEIHWRMKSRALWLQEGDRNTSFFHKQTQARNNYNLINEIYWQDQLWTDPEDIKEAAHSYFKELYSAPAQEDLEIDSYPLSEIPNLITENDNRILNRPISLKEIKKVVFRMNPDKAPGPDGFTPRFFTLCWDIIKKDLSKMIMRSQACTKIGGSTNSAFLALIPKEKGAKQLPRFRPISLCNTGYKIITKIIANRLKKMLPRLIPENQGGFVHGRQILDNIILVQEAIHSSYTKKEKGMAIKLDLANAFDRVRHDFLFAVMQRFGFDQQFINWVKACIKAPWIAPLVNGRPAKFFQASRGLRQGCPLSPMLYVLQASVLSYQLHYALHNRALSGIKTAPSVKEVSHTQFADDTLLLGAATLKTARILKSELDTYKLCSGSEINYHKSTIYGWHCNPRELLQISRVLEMEASTTWDNFIYLGIPIFKSSLKVAHWTPLIDKLKSKIQNWGVHWLNKAGKLVLMNAVITSLPIYQCSVLLAPKTISNKIDELLRKFFWEGGRNCERKLHLVNWSKVKTPQMEGGLNIRDVASHNIAMGGKILWNMTAGKQTWSKQLLRKKYFSGSRDRFLEKPPTTKKGSPIFHLCQRAMPLLKAQLTWIPGNGSKINIWEDSILGGQPLSELREIENIKEWLLHRNCSTLWDISTWKNDEKRSWEGWDLGNYPEELNDEASILLDLLQGNSPLSAGERDKRGWGTNSGVYTAAAGYKIVTSAPWVPPNPGPWKALWNFPSIPKVDLFAWTLLHNSILTFDNLQRRGWEGPSRCPLCTQSEETIAHLLFNCDYSKRVWELLVGPLALQIPAESQVLFNNWMSLSPFDLKKKHQLKTIWMWIPKFVCWKLWLERNNRIFKEEKRLPNQVAIKIQIMISEAINARPSVQNSAPTTKEEDNWIKVFRPTCQNHNQSTPPKLRKWEIRLPEQEFLKWRSSLEDWWLLFDGASKGNPGEAGGGGILLEPNGSTKLTYAWGLGYASNNQAEFLALWQGINQALKLGINKIKIAGDSKQVIDAINLNKPPMDMRLAQLHKKICILLDQIQEYKVYHVLRDLNRDADKEANRGSLQIKGQIIINEEISFYPIP
jgi:ribonuclease HI/exonuclease III